MSGRKLLSHPRTWVCRAWRPFRVRYGRRSGPGGTAARGSPVRTRCGCAADPRSWSRLIPNATGSRSPNGCAPRTGTAAGELGARDVVADPGRRPGPDPAHDDHLSDGRRPRLAMPPLEPVDAVGEIGGAGPDAPTAAVKVLTAQAVPVLRRVVWIRLHVFVRRARLPFSVGTWSSPPAAVTARAVQRRVRIASAVTVRPFGADISNSVGTAAIPFDLSSTRTCPNTGRAPPTNARTGCGGDRDAAAANDRRNALPSMATHPTAQPGHPTLGRPQHRPLQAPGSGVLNRLEKASRLGMPCASRMKPRGNPSSARPRRSSRRSSSRCTAPTEDRSSASRCRSGDGGHRPPLGWILMFPMGRKPPGSSYESVRPANELFAID